MYNFLGILGNLDALGILGRSGYANGKRKRDSEKLPPFLHNNYMSNYMIIICFAQGNEWAPLSLVLVPYSFVSIA